MWVSTDGDTFERIRTLIESPDTVVARLRNRFKESRGLLRREYPLEAVLHSVPLVGVGWQLSYLRLKSPDGTLVRRLHWIRMELRIDGVEVVARKRR